MISIEILMLIATMCNLPVSDGNVAKTFACYNNIIACVRNKTPSDYVLPQKDAPQNTTWVLDCIKEFDPNNPKSRPYN